MRQIIVGQTEHQNRRDACCSIPLLRWGMFSLLMLIGQTFAGNLPTIHAQSDPSGAPHLYFFTSDGCAPCEVVKPSIAKLAAAGYPTTVGRREGMIRHDELLDWFRTINYRPQAVANFPKTNLAEAKPAPKPIGTKVVLGNQKSFDSQTSNSVSLADAFRSPTMHQGTTQPTNAAESRAMAATVKIQVEDPEGISYATGTVIHTHKNESLVMTCGHVFRDSEGTGVIQAHYGFDGPTQKSGPGELIFYDADARDIALIVIKTEGPPLPAVEVASRKTIVSKGDKAFSIGCDNGEDPTIRHTEIKNRASYDGAIKKLDHLFDPATALAMASPSPVAPRPDALTKPSVVPKPPSKFRPLPTPKALPEDRPTEQLELPPRASFSSDLASGPKFPPARDRSDDRSKITPVSLGTDSKVVDYEHEVLIIMRSKDDMEPAKTITIDNPSHQLMDYLEKLTPQERTERAFNLARFREESQSGVRRPFQSSVRR